MATLDATITRKAKAAGKTASKRASAQRVSETRRQSHHTAPRVVKPTKAKRPALHPQTDTSRRYNERFGGLLGRAARDRRLALALGLLGLLFGGLSLLFASVNRVVPWGVHVDRQGQAVTLGPAVARGLNDEVLMRAFVLRFLFDLSRLEHAPEPKSEFVKASAASGSPVARLVNEQVARAATIPEANRMGVVFNGVVFGPTSDGRWSASWDETVRTTDGTDVKRRRKAVVGASVAIDADADANRYGLRFAVKSLEWVPVVTSTTPDKQK